MDVIIQKKDRNVGNKLVRRECGHLGMGLALYNVWMYGCSILVMLIQVVADLIAKADFSQAQFDQAVNRHMASGLGAVIAVVTGMLFLTLFYRKMDHSGIFEKKRTMTVRNFIVLFILFMMMQGVFSITGIGMEQGLNLFGYSMLEQISQAGSISVTASMLLYASFVGPIAEELLFRGFVQKTLRKYGVLQAIVIQAVLFGLFHGNLIQGIFAIGVGLVLGYVSEYYSIGWAIMIHIINNFVFSDVLGWCLMGCSETVSNVVLYGIQGGFFIAGLLILWRRKGKLKEAKQLFGWNHLKEILWNPGMLIFILMMLWMSLDGITKL